MLQFALPASTLVIAGTLPAPLGIALAVFALALLVAVILMVPPGR